MLRSIRDRVHAQWQSPSARRYATFAAIALLADHLTKWAAVHLLGALEYVGLGERLALWLVYNHGIAGGRDIGPWTWVVNVGVTTFALGLITTIVSPLGRIEARAPRALGLIAGGALGNLLSVLFGPPGVPDFIALRTAQGAVVINVADLALWGGALLLAPVVLSLLRAIRAERRLRPAASQLAQNPM